MAIVVIEMVICCATFNQKGVLFLSEKKEGLSLEAKYSSFRLGPLIFWSNCWCLLQTSSLSWLDVVFIVRLAALVDLVDVEVVPLSVVVSEPLLSSVGR